ncbi:MAG: CRISPR-associated endonuclease Cas1 [Candidatus Rokuibacteriota bacterium]
MESVIIADFGTMLGKTSERLVVRGPRPRLELIEGGPQLVLPIELPARAPLRVMTSAGVKTPPKPVARTGSSSGQRGTARIKPPQIELPLFRISEIIVTARGVSLSTDLIQVCCERGIRLSFLTPGGSPVAMLSSPMLTATVATRREQLAAYGDRRGLDLAKAVVRGKLGNQAALLKYFGKYLKTADPGAFARLDVAVRAIAGGRREVAGVPGVTVDEARGALLAIEGAAGRHYWSGVRALLDGHVAFEAREHRGAADPVNAALNYGYGILYAQVWGALMNAGLEPFAGFLHVDRPGKSSLVLDLIEEFRQPVVDRAVFAAMTKGAKLDMREGLLTDESRRVVAGVVLERLESEVGFRGRRHRLKSVIQIQARSLATHLRSGDAYRPFPFKW